ncbi:MAG TPA: hypothetical protein VNP96_06090 [Solirubrobacterales bacterium]|nr:hypothetical protein [Solirubrobacterales bacterium]
MNPQPDDRAPSLSVKGRVREIAAAESRALRDRQIAAVGRLLRRAALISKHGAASPATRSSPPTSRPRKRKR